MTPLFMVFYKLRALGPAWELLPVAALGTWALVVNGTFFAAISLRTRSREIMLPLLLFPISIPALLAMVQRNGGHSDGGRSGTILDRVACRPTMWCLLSLVSFFSRRCCRRNETTFPYPRGADGNPAGLCVLSRRCLSPPPTRLQGDVYRIIYYHVPSAWTAFVFFSDELCRIRRVLDTP